MKLPFSIALLLTCLIVSQAASAKQPNFIFLLTDDQGWADRSSVADPAHPDSRRDFLHTPNIDRLSQRSMNFTSGHASAIVSFWARHRDGVGDFAGRDEWLFDNQWHRLTFRFRATDPEHATFIYISLLPNQKPTETLVLVDDFELRATPAKVLSDERGERVKDSSFAAQKSGAIAPPWFFANIGGKGIRGENVAEGDAMFFRLGMDKTTSNYESAQLWQHLELSPGARYEITCRMRWENFTVAAPAPIVNYGIYHEPTRTWYGPVDQVLEKTSDWWTYRFTHIPPQPGPWKLYVQLNGWGNFGHAVTVAFDDLHCAPTAQKP